MERGVKTRLSIFNIVLNILIISMSNVIFNIICHIIKIFNTFNIFIILCNLQGVIIKTKIWRGSYILIKLVIYCEYYICIIQ